MMRRSLPLNAPTSYSASRVQRGTMYDDAQFEKWSAPGLKTYEGAND